MDYFTILLVLGAVCLAGATAAEEPREAAEEPENEPVSDLQSNESRWHHFKKFGYAGFPVSYGFPAYSYYSPYGPYGGIYGGYGYGYGGIVGYGYPAVYAYPYGYGYFR